MYRYDDTAGWRTDRIPEGVICGCTTAGPHRHITTASTAGQPTRGLQQHGEPQMEPPSVTLDRRTPGLGVTAGSMNCLGRVDIMSRKPEVFVQEWDSGKVTAVQTDTAYLTVYQPGASRAPEGASKQRMADTNEGGAAGWRADIAGGDAGVTLPAGSTVI